MRHIRGRVEFINEVVNEIDPYGEERWEDPLPLKFRGYEEQGLLKWLKDIGIEEIDINKIKFYIAVSNVHLKSKNEDEKSLGIKYFMDNAVPFIKTLKDKYYFEDEDDYFYLLGCITTEGLREYKK